MTFTKESLDEMVRKSIQPDQDGPKTMIDRLRKASRRPAPKLPRGVM